MEKTSHLINFVTAVALLASLTACFERTAIDKPPGRYESRSSTTDSEGTTYERRDSATVGYDSYGNKKAITETQTSKDPRGLLNKTTKTQETIEEK